MKFDLKKKTAAATIAAVMCFGTALPAFADSVNQDSEGTLSTTITFDYKDAPVQNDPTYTVTIPEAIVLTENGTPLTIAAENVANLNGQKISVTIAGTDKYRDQMLIEGKTADGKSASMRYQMIKEDGTVIETTPANVNGTELASFTEDGTATLTVKPVLSGSSSIKKDVVYTGSITYGIELVD